ncbi:Gfo/Idh/MocA family oxidoreductase [Mesorhizobium sp. BR1-1-16]|uniref:Gfo/Idh/MocA family protein n=1 Tax=Mesorhizobium sp. BR1-1-16 TaxID=2876653 RepID=UPI001CCA51CB|nr:Gfo/Idh/MocA family oxidoreductase [Mesorhizobium sp. BR1-1-16]MBZ9936950.1 Gfo/Idh/MocA family oxidoreductase [Mesorhizobium sp. BR1-1-16]
MPIQSARSAAPVQLGFLGVGRIGRIRMGSLLADGRATAIAVCDASPEMASAARSLAPDAAIVASLDELIEAAPDGIVIATPSALHAAQAIRALDAGIAVFCQKPLARTAEEVAAVMKAAAEADRPLGIDLSYRHTEGMRTIKERIGRGEIGKVYAADLVFHNAYGPDRPWFYDAALSGGGCIMDLGIHLIDLLLWTLEFPPVDAVRADLFARGRRFRAEEGGVEDFAIATIGLADGAAARIACSWDLHAGRDAEIGATFYGESGSLALANVGGSFLDFTAELRRGTKTEIIASPPDSWGGRAGNAWLDALSSGEGFDRAIVRHQLAAEVIDRIYGR